MLRPRGAVNLVTLVLVLGVAAVAYLGWIFIPPWMDNLDMREATTAAFNRMAVDPDDSRIRIFLLAKAKTTGSHWENRGGSRVEVRGLGLSESDIVIERDAESRSGRVSIDYQREIQLRPTDYFQTLDFHAEKAGPLPQ
ncbi:MAG TPA: hypothetical protein VK454_09840 [Myxococcaceae bacterium]|nr:hypothetical protein [Myxococcaceae bacterium]